MNNSADAMTAITTTHADQRLAEAEAALAKARGRAEMAHALATLPADAGDGDIVDLSEPYDAALHEAPPPPVTPAAQVRQPHKCGLWFSPTNMAACSVRRVAAMHVLRGESGHLPDDGTTRRKWLVERVLATSPRGRADPDDASG